ncbi:hypothetical protein D3C71_2005140 [compost metagenome]
MHRLTHLIARIGVYAQIGAFTLQSTPGRQLVGQLKVIFGDPSQGKQTSLGSRRAQLFKPFGHRLVFLVGVTRHYQDFAVAGQRRGCESWDVIEVFDQLHMSGA